MFKEVDGIIPVLFDALKYFTDQANTAKDVCNILNNLDRMFTSKMRMLTKTTCV